MKSRISLDYDFNKNKPFIRVDLTPSEDVKDRMLHEFMFNTSIQSEGNMYLECVSVNDNRGVGTVGLTTTYEITQGTTVSQVKSELIRVEPQRASVTFTLKEECKQEDGKYHYGPECDHTVGDSNRFTTIYENVLNVLPFHESQFSKLKSIEINFI